jgi:hypothetical protein
VDAPTVSLIIGLLAGTTTIGGWFYQKYREEQTRRTELTRKHLERQIEELYGPLYNLLNTMFVHYDVLHKLTKTKLTKEVLSEEKQIQIASYYEDSFFMPIHEELASILKSRLYLIDGKHVPQSFLLYLEHYTQHKAQRGIYKNLGIATDHVKGREWPTNFYEDVKSGFDTIMGRYEDCLQILRPTQKQLTNPSN